jgi:acyl-CoA oxidase
MGIGYAILFSACSIYKRLVSAQEDMKKGNFEALDQMHHLSSGMKSVYSQLCMDGLIIIR